MRTFTRTQLVVTTALAVDITACADLSGGPDVDGIAAAEDPVRFRDCPVYAPNCNVGNSPWVGSYAFSNFPKQANNPKPDPYGLATFELEGATRVIEEEEEDVTLIVGDLGRLKAEFDGFEYNIVGTTFTFTIDPVGAGSNTTASFYFKSETTPTSGTYFDMPRYVILTDIVPDDTDTFPEDTELSGWYQVCPQAEGTNQAIALPNVILGYDGALASVTIDDQTVVLACERQALAKGATSLEVLPASGVSVPHGGGTVNRQYGTQNYSALVNAYRAFYSGDARTTEGTEIYLKDLAYDPPKFDQAVGVNLPPTPIIGYHDFFLESVYDDGHGASCRSYTAEFPYGVHRNATYSPPALEFVAPTFQEWHGMANCDDATYDLEDHGSVAAYVIKHVIETDEVE